MSVANTSRQIKRTERKGLYLMKNFVAKFWGFVRKTMDWLLNRILHFNICEDKMDLVIQFIKFGLVGVSNTVVSYLVYVLCVSLGMYYILAQIFSFIVSVLNSFFWNNRYVFKASGEKERLWPLALLKTFIAYGSTGLLLNSVLLYIEVEIFHLNKLLGPLINLIVTIPLNYIINKFWAFKEK